MYVKPPRPDAVAVSDTLDPAHTAGVPVGEVIESVGGFTNVVVMVTLRVVLPVAVHPLLSDTLTEYVYPGLVLVVVGLAVVFCVPVAPKPAAAPPVVLQRNVEYVPEPPDGTEVNGRLEVELGPLQSVILLPDAGLTDIDGDA